MIVREVFQRSRISRATVFALTLSLMTFGGPNFSLLSTANSAIITSGNCSIDATGTGTVSVIDSTTTDGTCMVRITSGTAAFTLPAGVNLIRTLLVAGGGGGGFGGNGGAGGAGSVIYSTSGLLVQSGASISTTIGSGGTSPILDSDPTNQTYWGPGSNGNDSSMTISGTTYVATGGGGGGGQGSVNARYTGADGGSGGGTALNGASAGAAYNIDYANWSEAANAGFRSTSGGGGGGGGAGAAATSANGAIGLTILGYSVGGGGAGWSTGSNANSLPFGGGARRSSSGYTCTSNTCHGVANTGGGGGGGGNGGSGVAVIKFIPERSQGTIAHTGDNLFGRTRTFTFTRTNAVGTGVTATYQWQVRPAGSSTWSNVSTGTGGTTTSYTTAALTVADSGNSYRIVATDTNSTLGISTSTNTEVAGSIIPYLEVDYALNFNGSTQYVQAPDNSAFDLTGAFTIQAWIKPTDVSGYRMIVAKENSFLLYITNGVFTISADGPNNTWAVTLNNVPAVANEWHHVAVVRAASAANYTFYLDGVSVYAGALDAVGTVSLTNSSDAFTIGGRSGLSDQRFVGAIDNVAGFSSARSAANILADMNGYIDPNTANLQYYYDFNEGSGSTVFNHDVTGSSATDLTIYGGATYSDVKTVDNSTAYTEIEFPRTYITPLGGWKSPANRITYNALVVAGGGAGGSRKSSGAGGGGGAGGMIDTSYKTLDTSTIVAVRVGQGGLGELTGDMNDTIPGDNGANSVLTAGSTTFTAIGGGAGAGGTDSDLTSYRGRAGGSGGGASGSNNSGYAGGAALQTSGSGFSGYGSAGGANPGCAGLRPAGGGGGAGGVGQTPSTCSPAASGNGGAGRISSITGLTYAGGGGGGTSGDGGVTAGNGGSGGGANGGTWKTITGAVGAITLGYSATPNTGSGGGGIGAATGVTQGGAGAAGVIVIKYLAVALPTYTDPENDTTTAGLTHTFTVTGSAPSPWVRTYKWQSSSDTGTSWSDVSTGSGFTTASYTTPILETTTSGSRYQYRVIVIDTTGGTSVQDVSTSAFLIINPRLVLNGSYTVMKYGTTHTDTFTVPADSGSGLKTVRRTSTAKPFITWDTSTANTATVTVAILLPAGIYYDTITVTDQKSATTNFPIIITVLKADTITVTVADRNDTYTASSLSYVDTFTVSGLVAGDTISAVTYSYTGTANDGTVFNNSARPAIAGGYSIRPNFSIARASNYESVTVTNGTLTINRKLRTVSVSSKPTTLKYGETSTLVSTVSEGSADGTISYTSDTTARCTFSGAVLKAIEASSNCQFSATIGRGANYETATSPTYSATLTLADTLTVIVESITALTYTGNTAAVFPTIRVNGLVHTDTANNNGATFTYRSATSGGSFTSTKPINSDTYTVRADTLTVTSGLLSRYRGVAYIDGSLRINRAQQFDLVFIQFQSTFGQPYKAIAYGGSGTGAMSYSVSPGTASGCSIIGDTVTTTSEGSCLLTATRAQDQNYETKTATASIYFLNWQLLNSPAPAPGTGSTIALSGATSVTLDPNVAPTISSLSTYTAQAGVTSLVITGGGFDSSNLAGITVKFWRNVFASGFTVNAQNTQITVTVPAGATTGKVIVTTPNGQAVSEYTLTIS